MGDLLILGDASVLNAHSIKPLDPVALWRALDGVPAAVTLEDHNVLGGLGEAVAGIVAEQGSTRVLRLGVQDVFCEIGKPSELCDQYGLCVDDVVAKTETFLARSGGPK